LNLVHPVFAQYDYTGNEPADTAAPAVPVNETVSSNTLQWNEEGWKISVDKVRIDDGDLDIEKQTNEPSTPGTFDNNRIVVSSINGTFNNLSFLQDTLTATLDLSAQERCGMVLKKLDADFKFTPKLMEFNNLDLVTNKSHLQNYYAMRYDDFNDDMQDFVHLVKMEGHFQNSTLSSDDIAFFAPDVASWKENFLVSGNAKGSVDNLLARKMIIRAGNDNYLDGDMELRGLPDMDQTFIDFRSRTFKTNYNELARLIPDLRTITNPDLSSFGNINFTGSYTGFIRDFVTYGTLQTSIGTLKTDLQMKIPDKGVPVYNGKVSTDNFQLGKFIANKSLGNISFNGKIRGTGFTAKNMNVDIDGTATQLAFNGYEYTNIIAHGNLRKDMFSGSASIDDPNIGIDTLNGSVNFSRLHPEFNLRANVGRLNLKNLGFTKDSISLTGKFMLDFTGSNIDNFLGSAKIYNAILLDNEEHLSFDSLVVTSSVNEGRKTLSVQTNELEAGLSGDFKVLELPEAFQLFLSKYYPAYISRPATKTDNQDFTFLVRTRNVSDYVALFNKNIRGLDNSVFTGNVNIAENQLNIDADIPQFTFANINFNNLHFSGRGTQDSLAFDGRIEDVVFNDSLHAPGTRIHVTANNDISDVTIATSANRTLTAADLSARIQTKSDGFKLIFNPSDFSLNQRKWTIARGGMLELENNKLNVDNLKLEQGNEEINVSTQPSATDSLNDVVVDLKKLDIGDFAPLFFKSPQVNGYTSGSIRIHDPFGKFNVQFNTSTEQFRFDNDSVGIISASGEYSANTGNIATHVVSDNSLYNFSGDFKYLPKDSGSDQLQGAIVLNHSEIHILENYLSGIFHNIQGRATGKLYLSGPAAEAKLTGQVMLDSTAMTVDYTQCRYKIEDGTVLTFNPDEIDFGTIKIMDTLNNTATLTGKLYHSFFDNFFFNELHLKTDPRGNEPAKFILLNTTEKDNSDFYGNLVGDAELSLNGFSNDMKLTISGSPTDSSHIYLPTGETAETGSLDYIEFTKFGREMRPDQTSRESSNIKVEMNIDANPYAKIDVILDETTGDVIKAQGTGKLNISVGTTDPLVIRGRYDIEEGEYTFNFQTILHKWFTLQRGYIDWQGDPYLANLSIDALYKATGVDLSGVPTSSGLNANAKGDVDIIFKLRGTLKSPEPSFEFQFPFDNPLKSDPIATEYLKKFQSDQNELNREVTSLLLFNTFISNDQTLISSTSPVNIVAGSAGQILSSVLTSSLNSWLQKVLKSNSVNLYTNINTADFNFERGGTQKEIQNVSNFGVRTRFLNNRLLVNLGGSVDYRLAQTSLNANSNFLFTPDVSFEYLISPDGQLRVIGFNHSDTDIGDISGITRRNRTGIQLSYRREFDTFTEFFTNQKIKHRKTATEATSAN
ncbi:MAG TPA: translocation/assembly module TamB domain-containing protein, partial [Chitinophagaceae bacterium]|nr:translocation/assembly module TamB domain-containing protein [Chitinophagaceae bacterium]